MPDTTYQLTPHLHYETMFDGRLSVYQIKRGDRATIERWGQEVTAQLHTPDTPAVKLILHDFTTPALNVYPYMLRRGQQIADDTGDFAVKIAIAFPHSDTMRNLLLPLLEHLERSVMNAHPKHTMRLFESRDAALQWLQTFLPTP